jgi:hypothetical protein
MLSCLLTEAQDTRMEIETGTSRPEEQDLRELHEQIVAVLAMHGLQNNPRVEALMQPLLEGHLSCDEHMDMLEQLMLKLQDG